MALVIEPLDRQRHDRAAFRCGESSLDVYIQRHARQDVERNLTRCYILCEDGDRTIIGYYTLSAATIEAHEAPPDLARNTGGYRLVPAALIGRLAVDTRYRGQRMGETLLINALRRTLRSGVGVQAILVDALHDQAAAFYERYDFRRFPNDSLRLYLPMQYVRTIFPGEGPTTEPVEEGGTPGR